MITLILLHPLQSTPVQSWVFYDEPVIRIGRSTDNHVVLYSAVVSRHHIEIQKKESDWEVVSLGTNGTYLDGKRISQASVVDGMVIRLAGSGPKIQIRVGAAILQDLPKTMPVRRVSEQPATATSSSTKYPTRETLVGRKQEMNDPDLAKEDNSDEAPTETVLDIDLGQNNKTT